ncbi:MAG: hypothetical protein EAZ43_06580 [Betaproteobacteria bacterium]|nr:MAG: hypothetical protein EAZ43_06580 [Betaproteobacteria bacterium]
MHHHGRRRLAPNKRPPQSDPVTQEAFKKLLETPERIKAEWAQSAPVQLIFQHEARFGRISDLRSAWAPKLTRPLCTAMLIHEYTGSSAAIHIGERGTLMLPSVNGECVRVFLK